MLPITEPTFWYEFMEFLGLIAVFIFAYGVGYAVVDIIKERFKK